MPLDSEQIRKRWNRAWEAKQDELDRIDKSFLWLYEFEKHLIEGESGEGAYRFPEVMGYVMRRYNNYLEVLPEARVKGNSDASVALQHAIEQKQLEANLEMTKMTAIANTAATGTGCYQIVPFRHEKKYADGSEKCVYWGIASETVDWRHIFPAPGYKELHDHTGFNQMPYMFRRRVMHYESFMERGRKLGYKDLDKVQPSTWGDSNVWGDTNWMTPHELQELTSATEFVTTLEYLDVQDDAFEVYATGGINCYSSKEGIPYSHKSFPYHIYRNVPRLDSINGIGEIELNLPYNLFREKILNLGIDDIELTVQQPLIVDGEIGFNTEEQEVSPGAIFEVRGMAGGKLADHIMPMPIGGGMSSNVLQMIQTIENSRTAVTSDDATALYSNPNQLATQTMAKMQTLNKSIDGATKKNILSAEIVATKQIASFCKNEFAKPFSDGSKNIFMGIKVSGYDVVQDNDDAEVKFVKGYGAEGEYKLNPKVAESFDESMVEIVPAAKDEELKRDRTEKLVTFSSSLFSLIGNLASISPEMVQKVIGDMDVPEFLKVTAKNLGLEQDLKKVFPVVAKQEFELDAIEAEHRQVMMGITPEVRPEEDSMKELAKHMEFANSGFFKKHATKEAKKSMNEHIILTAQNVRKQNEIPVADRKKGLAQTQAGGQPGSVQGPNAMVAGAAPQSGAAVPVQGGEGGLAEGIPGGPAQPVPTLA